MPEAGINLHPQLYSKQTMENQIDVQDLETALELEVRHNGRTVLLPMELGDEVFTQGHRLHSAWWLTLDTAKVRKGFAQLGIILSELECNGFHEYITFVSVEGDVEGIHTLIRDNGPEVEWKIVKKAA